METELMLASHAPEQTRYWGRVIGAALGRGDVVALQGELGAGKTTLAQGIAEGLGVSDGCYVTSPTFTLINEYQGRIPLYHLDFYRITSLAESQDLGLEEYLCGEGVAVIEWPEKIAIWLSGDYLLIKLVLVGYTERMLNVSSRGHRSAELVRHVALHQAGREGAPPLPVTKNKGMD